MIYLKNFPLVFILLSISLSSFSKEKVEIVFSELANNNVKFIIDEVEDIYQRIGVETKISIYPEARLVSLFEKGEADAMGAKVELYDRKAKNVTKIKVPILKDVEFRIFIRANQLERVKSLKNPILIIANNCLSCLEFSKVHNLKVHNLKVSSYLDTIRMTLKVLYHGRADMVIAPTTIVSKLPKGMFMIYGDKSYKSSFFHYINKSIIHLKDKLEIEFSKSRKSNAFDLDQLGSLERILD